MEGEKLLIVDGHLDLAYNALQLNRDLTQPVVEIRKRDDDSIKRRFGSCTVTLPELRRGQVGIVFGTVMSRVDPKDDWLGTGMYCQEQCYGVGRGHAAYYQALVEAGEMRLIRNSSDLDEVVASWENPTRNTSIGLVLSMESADPILNPDQVPLWHELGLRMVGIAHFGTGAYSHGTGSEGGLLPRGKKLLDALKEAGIIVDLTHLTDRAFWKVLECYDGPVAASHHNCRALVQGQRQLTDDMIKAIDERNGVIGASLDAWMLDPDWKWRKPAGEQETAATLRTVVDHVDHIAQLVGNCSHSGIGSDLDGGFGVEQSPRDLDTIADLQKLKSVFSRRGYSDEDIRNILSGNWIRLLRESWAGK